MNLRFRIVDTGVRDGRWQIALDDAMLELHKAQRVPDTIRFLRFPPTVLVGRHQPLDDAIDIGLCRAEGVGIARRLTPGGAIYLDDGQIGWEVVVSRRRLVLPSLDDYGQAICRGVAHGLRAGFGVDAVPTPPNDITVAGAKLCGTGGTFDGDTLVYQGTVLVDVDLARIARLLRLPKAPAATPQRPLTTLKRLLGSSPDVAAVQGALVSGLCTALGAEAWPEPLTAEEAALAQRRHDDEIGTDAFVLGRAD